MKTIVIVLSAATLFAACSRNPNMVATQNSMIPASDTAGFAAFQNMKQQQEWAAFQAYKQQQALAAQAAYAVVPAQSAQPVRTVVRYVPAGTRSRSYASNARSERVVYTSESSNAARSRSRISKAAKGAIIGTVVGAGTGAVVHKRNRSKGAIIGGVIGAAGGYGIGRGMDKRDGRY